MPHAISLPESSQAVERLAMTIESVRSTSADVSSGAGAGNCYCTCAETE
jgi:hypothetical protein